MDTLNTQNDNMSGGGGMSVSETHSEKTASDEEDFKTNIPFFDEAHGEALAGQNLDEACADDDDDEDDDDLVGGHNSFNNYRNWDNDDAYIDDNLSRVGSEYSAYSASESANFYAPTTNRATTTSTSTPAAYEQQQQHEEVKYAPTMPSATALNYNYACMQLPSTAAAAAAAAATTTRLPQASPHAHARGAGGAAFGAYAQHAPGFHPNMWYPNAPYGTYYAPYGAHRYGHYNAAYPHDPMMDMLQLSNSGREARNRAEKNRRDKLNGSIQELSTMVPHVAESPRRVDKTAVLRFAAHGLRLQYVFGETLNQNRPQVTDALMKLLDSFLITLTCHGQIVLISSSIEHHLGHCQADLYGQNILHITHPEDHAMLKQQIIPSDLENLFDIQAGDENASESRHRTKAEEDFIDRKLNEDKRSFTVRLARAGPRSEPTTYEIVKLDGCFRRSDAAPRGIKTSTFPSTLQLIRRTRGGRDDTIPLHTISGNDIVLVAIARIIRPPKIINRVMESGALEYKTRHLIDGRIIDCDQRIGIVAGYMTNEVRHLSPFTFIHQDDVRWVIVALRQMYDCNSSYGESTYRLLTRNGNFIYLHTKGYLEIDKDNNKVHSFVCVNTMLDEEEGRRRVQEMKTRFSLFVKTKIPPSSVDAPAADNPQQLERAVLCLIQDLQKSSDDEENRASPQRQRTLSATQNASNQHLSAGSASTSGVRTTKTPPLALVPPEVSSVKTSILKSVNIIKETAAKNLRNQRVQSPASPALETGDSTALTCCTCNNNGTADCVHCRKANNSAATVSGNKRNLSASETDDDDDEDDEDENGVFDAVAVGDDVVDDDDGDDDIGKTPKRRRTCSSSRGMMQ